ncbi:hypothetical protein [Cohnella cholangitidis]|uniref:Uncharacterized protein n=1 Tax=Cohnella cholangitidis TaxID=2598458 RepID=A0A7G5BSV6_9BACL|nr:hypothetical protein [Cohnella cholangitidis]QMV40040.1 hypothetical protein FPL14_01610 [Cohnella cholangitidis]
MKMNWRKWIALLTLVVALLITALWQTGWMGLWKEGMAYIANDTKDFTDKSGYVIHGEYSVTIDLSDLASNVGKELYNDGDHKIYVAWVQNSGSANSGGYEIGFRSCGPYSLSGATLISGVHHQALGPQMFTSRNVAQMTAEYKGKSYNGSEAGHGGLNYKNGDDFSFYIFPSDAYADNEVTVNESGQVRIAISNLYKNVWSKV